MENRIEKLEELIVSQALQLSELHRSERRKTDVLRRMVCKLKKQLDANLELNKLVTANKLENDFIKQRVSDVKYGKIAYQKQLSKTTTLIAEKEKLQRNEDFLVEENARLNSLVSELRVGKKTFGSPLDNNLFEQNSNLREENRKLRGEVITVDEERLVAVISHYKGFFDKFVDNQTNEDRLNTKYFHITHLSQLNDRDGYHEIIRGQAWKFVCINSEYPLPANFDKIDKSLRSKIL